MRQIFILIVLFFLFQTIFALKPDRKYPYRPEYFGLIYKEFKVNTEDNLKLNVWFFPAQDTLPWGSVWQNPKKREYTVIDNQKRPTIVICPGDAGNMAPFAQFAYFMCNHGYNVVTFDWRGFGESDNWPINENFLCCTEFFMDINAVIDNIKILEEVDSSKIGICGYSMPAFQSFPVFQKRSDIKCYIGGALAADLNSVVEYWDKRGKKIVIPKDYTKDLYPENIADKITKPCLLIVGELDEITPAKMVVEKIYNKLKGDKEIWIIKDVGHSALFDKKVGFKNYVNRMVIFYDEHLK